MIELSSSDVVFSTKEKAEADRDSAVTKNMVTNMDTNNINKDSYFKKFWFPLVSGTIISIPIYILFKPDTTWIFCGNIFNNLFESAYSKSA